MDAADKRALKCVVAYAFIGIATFIYVYDHSGLDRFDRGPASIAAGLAWPIYAPVKLGFIIDDWITSGLTTPSLTCMDEQGNSWKPEGNLLSWTCRPRKASRVIGSIGGATLLQADGKLLQCIDLQGHPWEPQEGSNYLITCKGSN